MLNKVQLIGHVGADPEIRRMQDGRPIANLRIATSDQWRDKATGEKKESTQWHSIVAFPPNEGEGLCGVIEKYVKKGSRIFVEGKLETRTWDDQQGVKRYTTEIILRPFESRLLLLDRAEKAPAHDDDGRGAPVGDADRYRDASGGRSAAPARDELDDEIPF